MRKSRSSIPMWTWVPKMRSRCARSCRSSRTPIYRSSGVISWSCQEENGWLPAAATLRPCLAARSITRRRSRTSTPRTSAGARHTLVPTSTMDWGSSGFTSPSTRDSSFRISVMYERSSRVAGSMIWYSSSIPIVREGGFMRPRFSSLLDDERRHRRASARRHVHQRGRAPPGETAVRVGAAEDERRRVHDPVREDQRAVRHGGEALARERDPLLHDVGCLEGGRERGVPGGGVHLPAQHDAGSAVGVVGLER